MIEFQSLFSSWPTREILSRKISFRPRRFRAISNEELIELKNSAIEEGQATVETLCQGYGISVDLYEFETSEHMAHPATMIVIDCDYSGILLTE